MGGGTRVSVSGTAAAFHEAPVLVTGASGFLGTHVCVALVAQGCTVRALVRDGARAPAGAIPFVAPDLLDREAIRRAMVGAGTVVHLAARVHVMRDRAADPDALYRATNVEGTRVLLEEAIRAGVPRFVFISSVKAVGEGSVIAWTERTPPAPVDPYGRSKLEAERLVRTLADAAGVHAPILRLPLVYGPGMKGNMLSLFTAVQRGIPLPLGAIDNRRSLVYSGNVVAAIHAIATTPSVPRETFFVSDGQDLSTTELIRAIGTALGRQPRLLPVPVTVFHAAARVGDLVSRVVPFPLTTAAVHRLFGTLVVDSRHLRAATGFTPPFTVHQGLQETAAWFRGAPLLPPR